MVLRHIAQVFCVDDLEEWRDKRSPEEEGVGVVGERMDDDEERESAAVSETRRRPSVLTEALTAAEEDDESSSSVPGT